MASLRVTATIAFCFPRRRATAIPHALSGFKTLPGQSLPDPEKRKTATISSGIVISVTRESNGAGTIVHAVFLSAGKTAFVLSPTLRDLVADEHHGGRSAIQLP
jgi:hypothetical protein